MTYENKTVSPPKVSERNTWPRVDRSLRYMFIKLYPSLDGVKSKR